MDERRAGREIGAVPTAKILKPEARTVWIGAVPVEYEATAPDRDALVVRLEYCCMDDDAGWQLIADGQENTGMCLWDLAELARGGLCKVRIIAADSDGRVAEAVSDEFAVVVPERMVMAAPDPVKGVVTFHYDVGADAVIYVYDAGGRLIHTAELLARTNAYECDLTMHGGRVAAGPYLYAVVSCDGEKSMVGRFTVEK